MRVFLDHEEGGIGQVALLKRSNIIALVGGGGNPRYSLNKVVLLDEKKDKPLAELEFRSDVKRVLMMGNQYVAITDWMLIV